MVEALGSRRITLFAVVLASSSGRMLHLVKKFTKPRESQIFSQNKKRVRQL